MTYSAPPPPGRSRIRVLHIEDNPSDAAIVRRLLGRLGETEFVIDTATSAAEATRRLASHRYDLIFLDNGLPDEDGLSLLRRVGTLGAPVIMLTAQEEIRRDALDAGAAAFLSKNALDGEELSRAIAAVLGPFPGEQA